MRNTIFDLQFIINRKKNWEMPSKNVQIFISYVSERCVIIKIPITDTSDFTIRFKDLS